MKKEDRELLRTFYQSIPTKAEKDRFEHVLNSTKAERIKYVLALSGKGVGDETIDAILAASHLTKEDRVSIFAGWFRSFIFSLLGF